MKGLFQRGLFDHRIFRHRIFQHRVVRQGVYAFDLLLERRLAVFLIADFIVILQGLLTALDDPRTDVKIFVGSYSSVVVFPILLLGVPVLASAGALERRAGSLDLALAVPSTEAYFLRRCGPVCAFLLAQGWLLGALCYYTFVMDGNVFAYLLSAKGLLVLPIMVHTVLTTLLVGTVTLFWASRIPTTGATAVAAALTLFALSKWIFASPVVEGLGPKGSWLLGVVPPVLVALVWNLGVLALASLLFYLYARERLRRPEVMLA